MAVPAAKIAPIQPVTFSVMSGDYGTFMTTLRGALAGASPEMVGPQVQGQRPELAKQTAENEQPPRWIHVELVGKGGAAPKVAVRSDNAYIMGFTNSQGTWFQLSKTKTKDKLVADNPVMLGFDGHYQTLVGGVANLTTLDVRKFSTADAAAKLWNHTAAAAVSSNSNNLDDDEDAELLAAANQLKPVVATLCVVISEAARFTPVYGFIDDRWDSNAKVSITNQEVGYIREWSDISTALLAWKKDAYRNDDKHFKKFAGIGITDGEQALAAVQLVLQAKRGVLLPAGVRDMLMAAATGGYGDVPTDEQLLAYTELPRHGRYLAEVFAVRVPAAAGGNRPPPCGTISFHGGHRCSDFIYSWIPAEEPTSVQTCDNQGNLVLTGPSVATSAYGPIIFNLDLHDGSRGSSSRDEEAATDVENDERNTAGKMLCDVVGSDFSNYDRAIVETVRTAYGPAEVTYAVLSNAVEGRVAVKLARLVGDDDAAGVLGRITARSDLFDVGCVLFYNDDGGKDDVLRVRPGEMIPLARHALAVPLHMPLTIELDLHCNSGDEIVRRALAFNPMIDGQHTEHIIGMNGTEFQVTISWSHYPW